MTHSHDFRHLFTIITLCAQFFLTINTAAAQSWACKGKTGCTTPTSACPDGSLFAGCPAPSYAPIYITRCDAGRTWNGAVCGGTAGTYTWNNGNSTGYVSVGGLSQSNGKTNTATLASTDSDSGVGGSQPHVAAAYCDQLVMHGYSDWYLPAVTEMQTIRTHIQQTNDMTSTYYWISTQDNNTDAFKKSNSTLLFPDWKYVLLTVRCARKD